MNIAPLIHGVVLAVLLITPPAVTGQGSRVRFVARDLGTFRGGYQTVGGDINNSGQIAGYASLPDPSNPELEGPYHTFLYQNGRLRDLGVLPGYVWGYSGRINDRGQILAYQSTANFASSVAVLYDRGRIINLNRVLGDGVYPSFINNRGAIVGSSRSAGTTVTTAFIYKNGVLTLLGALVPGAESGGIDINDSGDAVGYAMVEPGVLGTFHAVLFSHGQILDIGVLPGYEHSSAYRITRSGHILGNCGTRVPERSRGFLFRDGVMHDIGALAGDTDSLALSLNDDDHIVGVSTRVERGSFVQRATLHIEGKVRDLNDLIPRGSGWKLYAAVGINDRDEIIAVGDHNIEGLQRTCLLIPVQPLERSTEYLRMPQRRNPFLQKP